MNLRNDSVSRIPRIIKEQDGKRSIKHQSQRSKEDIHSTTQSSTDIIHPFRQLYRLVRKALPVIPVAPDFHATVAGADRTRAPDGTAVEDVLVSVAAIPSTRIWMLAQT